MPEILNATPLWAPRSRRLACVLLVLVSAAIRFPLLGHFDLVSYDGTYYINQARTFWSQAPPPGAFPPGYPLLISALLPVVRDGVHAAQWVSLIAALVSVCAFYLLADRLLGRRMAFYAALVLTVSPLFIRISVQTFSEPAYTMWLLVALAAFARGRDLMTGTAGGLAAITRPEALGVIGLLALVRARQPRRAAMILIPFLLVYAGSVAHSYRSTGEVRLLPKGEFFGAGAEDWHERERVADADTTGGVAEPEAAAPSLWADYVHKLRLDIRLLALNLAFVPALLALYGIVARRTFLLVALVPMVVGPLFTVRAGTERYLLPFLPVVILYAFIGAEALGRRGLRTAALAAIAACALGAPALNWDRLTAPVDEGFEEMRTAGRFLHGLVHPGDKIADRKPYVAFYADAEYVEIPHGSYEEATAQLVRDDVRFLSLHYETITGLRPLFAPLLTHGPAIAGELRFKQIYAVPAGLIVYERVRDDDPLRVTPLTAPERGRDAAPCWSPDGRRIAFASSRGGDADIYLIDAAGGEPERAVGGGADEGQPAWSPDGSRIAFASTRAGDWDIYVADLASGAVTTVAVAPGRDMWPAWSRDGRAIVFSSERTGRAELWRIELGSGRLTQLTHDGGNNNCPALAPDGTRLAWTRSLRELVILDLDTNQRVVVQSPTQVDGTPAWSPDGRYLAVAARDWGSMDIYIVTRSGRRQLLLTKNWHPDARRSFDAFPSWSPDGERLAIVSNRDGAMGIYVLEGLREYLDRLDKPLKFAKLEEESAPARPRSR